MDRSLAQNRSQNLQVLQNRNWFRIDNKAKPDGPALVYIYDEIGFFGVSAQDFVSELGNVTAPQIDLHLNSPGGDYFAGVTIHNAIRQHPAEVTVHIDGLAASAASVIAMAGDRLVMHPGSQLMIHDALSLAIGNAGELRQTADLLDKCSDDIAGFYAGKAKAEAGFFRERMKEETWYSAQEAVDAGLADEVMGSRPQEPVDMPVAAKWDLSLFKYSGREQAPEPVVDKTPEPEPVSEKQGDEPVLPVSINADQLMAAILKGIRQ